MAGRIPKPFIDDLIARADVVEVVGRRITLKKAGREYKACCPFHNEKTPSFQINPQNRECDCCQNNTYNTRWRMVKLIKQFLSFIRYH